jgi:3-deoxy-D-manno-octulosonic-acid transferase
LLNLFIVLAFPFFVLKKTRRFFRRRLHVDYSPLRWSADSPTPELTKAFLSRPGKHVVFAGVGYGETVLMQRVADALLKARPDVKVTLCIREPHSLEAVAKQYPEQHLAPWPIDFVVPILRWLKRYRPEMIVFTESFRARAFTTACSLYGVKVAVINGRCARRDSLFHRLFASYYRWTFGAIDGFLMLSEESLMAARQFARPDAQMRHTGDVKFDLEAKKLEEGQMASLDEWLSQAQGAPILGAGSTENANEENMVFRAFLETRAKVGCRLLLAPRKLVRADESVRLALEHGLSVSRRTENGPDADVYLLDTLGELAYSYRHCAAAYVGGSYEGLGHNVAEPLEWGVPVSYGMKRGHFRNLQEACEEAGLSVRISRSEDLARHWIEMLEGPELRRVIAEGAQKMLETQRGALNRTVVALSSLLDDSVATSRAEEPDQVRSGPSVRV